ncbi:MAG: WecB/TagA/CpsF family glycosyltransferase [Oculatellaceae cyanobacterium Prado106]|jgi:N-acetylglucosaminyldiphosphoundecaprenol N-acetyl-beta-D-mannosaminyltransferase|nr:WecB/TagA/CpsF family glycosyltransferase [Oculatellaceae cyanobacterium Prado106]
MQQNPTVVNRPALYEQPDPSDPWRHAVELCRVSLLSVDEATCIDRIIQALSQNEGGWCVTVNLEILRQITQDKALYELVQGSTMRVADGITLVWASQLQGTPLPERVCGSNLIFNLTAALAQQGRSIFLLGGNPGTAERAAAVLQQNNPNLRVVGTFCPSFGFEDDPAQIQEMATMIQQANPDVIYVALGFPKSEKLITQIRSACPQSWWMGVGISFSYVSGEVERAPQWAQDVGLESLYRLLQEPRRLAKRYLLVGPPFAAKLLLTSCFRGMWQSSK